MKRASAVVTGAAAIASPFIVAFTDAAPANAAEINGLSTSDNLPHRITTPPVNAELEMIKRFCAASNGTAAETIAPTPSSDGDVPTAAPDGQAWATALVAPMHADPYFADMVDFMERHNVIVCKSDTIGAPSKMVEFGDTAQFLQLDPSRAVTGLQRQRIPAGDGGAMFAMLSALRTEMNDESLASATIALNEVGLKSMRFNPAYDLDTNHLKLRASYIDHILYIAEASLRMKEVAGDSRLHDFLRQFPYPPTTAVGLARDMEDALRETMDENNHGDITSYNRRAVFDKFFTKPGVFNSLDSTFPGAFLQQLTRRGYNPDTGSHAVLPKNFAMASMSMDDFTSGGIGERHNGNYIDGGKNIMTSDYYRLPPYDVDNAIAMMQVRHALGQAQYSRPDIVVPGTPQKQENSMEAVFTPI